MEQEKALQSIGPKNGYRSYVSIKRQFQGGESGKRERKMWKNRVRERGKRGRVGGKKNQRVEGGQSLPGRLATGILKCGIRLQS